MAVNMGVLSKSPPAEPPGRATNSGVMAPANMKRELAAPERATRQSRQTQTPAQFA